MSGLLQHRTTHYTTPHHITLHHTTPQHPDDHRTTPTTCIIDSMRCGSRSWHLTPPPNQYPRTLHLQHLEAAASFVALPIRISPPPRFEKETTRIELHVLSTPWLDKIKCHVQENKTASGNQARKKVYETTRVEPSLGWISSKWIGATG